MVSRLKQVERENEVLREVVAFYARRGTWRRKLRTPRGIVPRRFDKSEAVLDRGARALYVLGQLQSTRDQAGLLAKLRALVRRQPVLDEWKPTVPAPLSQTASGEG